MCDFSDEELRALVSDMMCASFHRGAASSIPPYCFDAEMNRLMLYGSVRPPSDAEAEFIPITDSE